MIMGTDWGQALQSDISNSFAPSSGLPSHSEPLGARRFLAADTHALGTPRRFRFPVGFLLIVTARRRACVFIIPTNFEWLRRHSDVHSVNSIWAISSRLSLRQFFISSVRHPEVYDIVWVSLEFKN